MTSTRRWVLNADISQFFSKISHNWLMENVLMDKRILEQFIKAGFVEGFTKYDTSEGTPQGGVI